MTLRDYPHLPLLTVPQFLAAFALAGVRPGSLSALLGVSRMTVYKWRFRGTVPFSTVQQTVSTLAYKALRAVRTGALPLAPSACANDIYAVLRAGESEPLDKFKAEDLLDLLPPQ